MAKFRSNFKIAADDKPQNLSYLTVFQNAIYVYLKTCL